MKPLNLIILLILCTIICSCEKLLESFENKDNTSYRIKTISIFDGDNTIVKTKFDLTYSDEKLDQQTIIYRDSLGDIIKNASIIYEYFANEITEELSINNNLHTKTIYELDDELLVRKESAFWFDNQWNNNNKSLFSYNNNILKEQQFFSVENNNFIYSAKAEYDYNLNDESIWTMYDENEKIIMKNIFYHNNGKITRLEVSEPTSSGSMKVVFKFNYTYDNDRVSKVEQMVLNGTNWSHYITTNYTYNSMGLLEIEENLMPLVDSKVKTHYTWEKGQGNYSIFMEDPSMSPLGLNLLSK